MKIFINRQKTSLLDFFIDDIMKQLLVRNYLNEKNNAGIRDKEETIQEPTIG